MGSNDETVSHFKDKFYEFRDFFWVPNAFFKSVGYDFIGTSKGKTMRNFVSLSKYIIIVCHMYFNCSMAVQVFRMEFKAELMDIIRLATSLAYSFNSNVKYLGFLAHRKLAHHIYDTLLEAYPRTKKEKQIFDVNMFYWSKIERCTIVFYIISCWNVVFSPLLQSIYIYTQTNDFPYLTCYPVDLNFDYRMPLRYFFVFLVGMAHSHYMIMVNWGTDLWLVCFTGQICMHLKYIGRSIEMHEPKMEDSQKNCEFLIKLIKRHQTMLSLNNDLNTIFGISLAFNLISTTGVLCIVAMRLFAQGLSVEFFVFSTFLANAIAQFYLVCYYGQKLSELSEKIAWAAYMNTWHNSSAAYKKMLLIITLRSQNEAQLLAVGLKPLSMGTFQAFVGHAYRIFALLQTVLDLKF